MYRPVSSASVAEDITFLMMCAMFSIAPLFGGTVVLLERKKCPPAWLRAFGLLNSLTGYYVLVGRKIVLFGRYTHDLYME
jgi:hypothetical protein